MKFVLLCLAVVGLLLFHCGAGCAACPSGLCPAPAAPVSVATLTLDLPVVATVADVGPAPGPALEAKAKTPAPVAVPATVLVRAIPIRSTSYAMFKAKPVRRLLKAMIFRRRC